jgi:hypothetical protein
MVTAIRDGGVYQRSEASLGTSMDTKQSIALCTEVPGSSTDQVVRFQDLAFHESPAVVYRI